MHALPKSSILVGVATKLHDFLGTKVETDSPLMQAGLDSVSATEVTRLLSEEFRVTLPSTLLFDYPTVEDISGFLTRSAALVPKSTSSEKVMP